MRNGDPMGRAGEVLEHVRWLVQRMLGVDHPLVLAELLQQTLPGLGLGQGLAGAGPGQGLCSPGLGESCQEAAPKEAPSHLDGQEEGGGARHPGRAVWGEPSAWDDTGQVRMVLQWLAPGVQDRQKAKMGPEMPGILRDRQEGLCDRVKEEGVEASPSKVLLFFGNFVPLARRRDPVKEGQGCRWHWGKSSNRLWNSDRSV
jgi:hypothetical protein